MNTNDATRANAEAMHEAETENRDIGDAIDILVRALTASDLLYMAGTAMFHDFKEKEGEAVMAGVDILRDMLQEAKDVLYANLPSRHADGDRLVGHIGNSALSELLDAQSQARQAINAPDLDDDDPALTELNSLHSRLSLAICGYRPRTEQEQRQKAEFLRSWTADTHLTEEEQAALIASLMPKGGAA